MKLAAPFVVSSLVFLASCAFQQHGCPIVRTTSVSMQTSIGEVIIELDWEHAPITVANFLEHAKAGDYDGTIFHRVIPGFVVQGGGFTPDLRERAKLDEAAGRKDKAIVNEWRNGLKNETGTIAMARDTEPDTASREFYFNLKHNEKLDTPRSTTGNAGYAVFGRLTRGWEIIERVAQGKTMSRPDIIVDGEGMQNVPVEPVIILSVKRIDMK